MSYDEFTMIGPVVLSRHAAGSGLCQVRIGEHERIARPGELAAELRDMARDFLEAAAELEQEVHRQAHERRP